jgi:chromosome segregation ATPase
VGLGRAIASVGLALLAAAPCLAADLGAMEHAVREACEERSRLLEQRKQGIASAALLADEIAQLKSDTGRASRADRNLEDALKRFDRVAGQLDELDRQLSDRDRSISALRRRFEEAATAEASRLNANGNVGSIGEVARELDAIERARRRVAGLGAPEPPFRPLLDVTLSEADAPFEVEQKLQLLESERDRVKNEIARLDAEAGVLTVRILLRRQLLAELEVAARTAGAELGLLRREAENVGETLNDLIVQRTALIRQNSDLSASLAQVERRLEEFRARLKEVGAPTGGVR